MLGFFLRKGSYVQGSSVRKLQMALLVIGVFGLLLGSLLGIWPGLLGMLSLSGWTAGQAGSQAWEAWKGDRETAVRFLGNLPIMPVLHRGIQSAHWPRMLRKGEVGNLGHSAA